MVRKPTQTDVRVARVPGLFNKILLQFAQIVLIRFAEAPRRPGKGEDEKE